MTHDDIIAMAREAGLFVPQTGIPENGALMRFAALVAAAERETVLATVDAVYGQEDDRHPMFAEGYNHALSHIEESVRGRSEA